MVPTTEILQGNALEVLAGLPDAHFHCCVTSPPYWGLRDYKSPPTVWGGDPDCSHEWGDAGVLRTGRDYDPFTGGSSPVGRDTSTSSGAICRCGAWLGCLGLEPSPWLFIDHLVMIFREVRRVLRPDGTLWVNMGDSFANDTKWGGSTGGKHAISLHGASGIGRGKVSTGLKPKDLVGIPWRLAFALQDDGWWLRRDIVWEKPNSMPESVTDRPSTAHEYIFLLTKAPRYFYDGEAVKVPVALSQMGRIRNDQVGGASHAERGQHSAGGRYCTDKQAGHGRRHAGFNARWDDAEDAGLVGGLRSCRSVWEIATQPYADAHFATFPEKLPRTCILAGTSQKGCCASCGAPWRRVVERTDEPDASAKGSRFDAGKTGARDGGDRTQAGDRCVKVSAGWEPGCSCGAEVVPCRVLDPFAGSGTTLAVAYRLGRSGVGIEVNPEYITLAERRIGKETPALDLF
jgi:DNA modification methylase